MPLATNSNSIQREIFVAGNFHGSLETSIYIGNNIRGLYFRGHV